MDIIHELPLFILLNTIILCVGVAFFSWRRKETSGDRYFMLLVISVGFWTACTLGEYLAPNSDQKIVWALIAYPAIVNVSPFWFLFTANFTRKDEWLTVSRRVLLWIIPVITVVLVFTNSYHHLIWADIIPITSDPGSPLDYHHGYFFWVYALYSYLLLLVGTFWLVRMAVQSQSVFKKQVFILVAGAVIPWVSNALYLLKINPWPGLDLTPVAFALTGAFMFYGLLRFRMFDLTPVARDAIFEKLIDAILVINNENIIIDVNPTASTLIGLAPQAVIGKPVREVLAPWSRYLDRYRNSLEVQDEVMIDDNMWIAVRVSPLPDHNHKTGGRIIVI